MHSPWRALAVLMAAFLATGCLAGAAALRGGAAAGLLRGGVLRSAGAGMARGAVGRVWLAPRVGRVLPAFVDLVGTTALLSPGRFGPATRIRVGGGKLRVEGSAGRSIATADLQRGSRSFTFRDNEGRIVGRGEVRGRTLRICDSSECRDVDLEVSGAGGAEVADLLDAFLNASEMAVEGDGVSIPFVRMLQGEFATREELDQLAWRLVGMTASTDRLRERDEDLASEQQRLRAGFEDLQQTLAESYAHLSGRVDGVERDVQGLSDDVEQMKKFLKAPSTTLSFNVQPSALVWVDGYLLGWTPFAPKVLTPGRHAVRLEASGFDPVVLHVDLRANDPKTVVYRFGQAGR